MISLIVAADEHNVIGGGNKLLWKLPADLKHFRELTTGHAIIMGRKTYASIGRPLPDRQNIVVTRHSQEISGCDVVGSIDEALELAKDAREIFVIGGGEIYRQALPLVQRIYLTRVHGTFEGDVTFPELNMTEWKEMSREQHPADEKNPHAYTFLVYERMAP